MPFTPPLLAAAAAAAAAGDGDAVEMGEGRARDTAMGSVGWGGGCSGSSDDDWRTGIVTDRDSDTGRGNTGPSPADGPVSWKTV